MKLRAYHEKHPEDIENAVNEFFSTENPELTQPTIDNLLDLDIPSGYDDTDPTLDDIEDEFNGWWNLDRMASRKAEIVSLILMSLTYDIDDPEYQDEFKEVLDHPETLEEMVVDDLRKRTEQVM
ncbi:hypothetical protein HSEST_0176 [Halapricum desulfuricans]|uniref:Uncharacterized protein n=2 Tax=Halapricum desulfuricans TaxID=2841257 RepID=A0A897NLV0_9EURY|nr:hypothetical protein HSEST_0176 [Halapricum desulfuricans]